MRIKTRRRRDEDQNFGSGTIIEESVLPREEGKRKDEDDEQRSRVSVPHTVLRRIPHPLASLSPSSL